jgi:hypothetical protein
MASKYSSPIHSRIIDPIFDRANFRAEFRLQPNTCYYSDIRLTDVGCTSDVATNYQLSLGSEGVIRSISLMDGGTTLDVLHEASLWNNFKNMNSRNDGNISVNRYTKNNGLGFLAVGSMSVENTTYGQNAVAQTQDALVNEVNTAFATTKKAWISLKDMLPMLRESNFLPTNLYKKLRIVIEFKPQADLANVVINNNRNYSTTSPTLLVDELADTPEKMAIMKNYKGVQFDAIELDRYVVNKIGAGLTDADANDVNFQQTVNVNQQVKGFNEKMLKRLVVMCQPTEQTATAADATINKPFSNQSSVSLYRPIFQFRVNGQNIYPGQGVEGKNRRLALLNDTYGNLNVTAGFNKYGTRMPENLYDANLTNTVGQADYTALPIMANIQDLQIQLQRSALYAGAANNNTNAQVNQKLTINLWGEVAKAIIVGPGGYNVVYV